MRKDEYKNFSEALKKVLQVSHSEMKAELDKEKKQKEKKKGRN